MLATWLATGNPSTRNPQEGVLAGWGHHKAGWLGKAKRSVTFCPIFLSCFFSVSLWPARCVCITPSLPVCCVVCVLYSAWRAWRGIWVGIGETKRGVGKQASKRGLVRWLVGRGMDGWNGVCEGDGCCGGGGVWFGWTGLVWDGLVWNGMVWCLWFSCLVGWGEGGGLVWSLPPALLVSCFFPPASGCGCFCCCCFCCACYF